jgi:hypothetical protein
MLNSFRRGRLLAAILLSLFTAPNLRAALTLNLDFTDFYTNAPSATTLASILRNDAWTSTTPANERLAGAEQVIRQAAAYWENAYVACSDTQVNLTIDVTWNAIGGSTLARGGASWFTNPPYRLGDSYIEWDRDGSSSFYVDLQPSDNAEYNLSSTRSSLLGQNINVEHVYFDANTSSSVFAHSDMLSVATHELGHSLGILSSYPKYAALDAGSNGSLDLEANEATWEAPYVGGHLNNTLSSFPSSFPARGFFINGTHYPSVMGPLIVTGTRKLLSDLDVLLLANVHGFGSTDYSCVAEPFNTVTPSPPTGDFNGDFAVNATDIDLLFANLNSADLAFDLDLDLAVTTNDVNFLLEQILNTTLGDANLDGSVDAVDLEIWNASRFSSGTGWALANFDGRGGTDASDFHIWLAHRGFSSVAASIPEPASSSLSLLLAFSWAARRNPKRERGAHRNPTR